MVSGGGGFDCRPSQKTRLTDLPKKTSKLISLSQILCDRLFSVNSGHARYPDMLTWIIHVRVAEIYYRQSS